MERVAFLIEGTGERLPALLNPESLVMRRVAGVRPRLSHSGQLTGAGLPDDPLLYTGGGRTELDLELLFDVSLAGSSISTNNVRDLTAPLWALAENAPDGMLNGGDRHGRPLLARFVWGKAWNVLGVVTSIAERLERFDFDGSPQRSWLSMRLVRVSEPYMQAPPPRPREVMYLLPESPPGTIDTDSTGRVQVHEVIGGGGPRGSGERLDDIALRYYGDASLWRLIAAYNDVADPTQLARGTLLYLPPLPTSSTAGTQT